MDGTEDEQIVREAGKFWNAMGMRAIVNKEIETVRTEARAKRLSWTQHDVKSLIPEYPVHKATDDVIEKQGEHFGAAGDVTAVAGVDGETEPAVADNDGGAEVAAESEHVSEDESDTESSDREALQAEWNATSAAVAAEEAQRDLEPEHELSLREAEDLERSQTLISTLEESIKGLRQVGAVVACMSLENELHKERRRQRNLSAESPAVAEALARQRHLADVKERRQKRIIDEANAEMKQLRDEAVKEAEQAKSQLKKRKAALAALENLLESKQAIKRFPEHALGVGHPTGGGAQGRKARHEVLDRIACTGAGLSQPQKNDWAWFKDSWDHKMVQQYAAEWGGKFTSWMQEILNRIEDGVSNAFSVFVNSETRRCFSDCKGLVIGALENR